MPDRELTWEGVSESNRNDPAVAPRSRVDTAALQYRPDIDGLRGLAVGLVVAYHGFPKFRTGGFIGVDVFFVISGYLITQLVLTGLQAGTFSLGEFYRRRVRRIVPAAAQTGAKAVDPRSALCDGMICPAAGSDGIPLYLDSNHLNGYAARKRASFVDEMLLGPDTQQLPRYP
jgi:Acyltransferase family/SGNH domain (fused to AT3 domains)